MKLTREAIEEKREAGAFFGRELLCFDALDSTNTYIKTHAELPDGTAVVADRQTAGRGRQSRVFESPAGKGLYLSVLFRPDADADADALLSLTALAGVAVARAVETVSGLAPHIKWPNDLLLHGKKLVGILAERQLTPNERPAVILGVGVNVSQAQTDFTPEVAAIATSLAMQGATVDRAALAAAILRELDAMRDLVLSGDTARWLGEYRARCENIGKEVRLIAADGSERRALVTGVDDRYGLEVLIGGKREVIRTGELSLRPL